MTHNISYGCDIIITLNRRYDNVMTPNVQGIRVSLNREVKPTVYAGGLAADL